MWAACLAALGGCSGTLFTARPDRRLCGTEYLPVVADVVGAAAATGIAVGNARVKQGAFFVGSEGFTWVAGAAAVGFASSAIFGAVMTPRCPPAPRTNE
jgi:hypothetical protein